MQSSWLNELISRIRGSQALKRSLKREPLFLDMLQRGLGSSPCTMVSIGSSDGGEILYALKQKGTLVTAHLLEPDPENLEKCRNNLQTNKHSGQVSFHRLAVSNKSTNGSFYRNPEAPNLNSATPTSAASIKIDVEYTTLDSFLKTEYIQPPILVNMDIEGHEVEVLEGLLEHASQKTDLRILMEVHPSLYSASHSLEKILKQYFYFGFRVSFVESAGSPRPEHFRLADMTPIRIEKNRALYQAPSNDFVLQTACHVHSDAPNEKGRTSSKVVRSLLIELNK